MSIFPFDYNKLKMKPKNLMIGALTIAGVAAASYKIGQENERKKHEFDSFEVEVDYCDNSIHIGMESGEREFFYNDNLDSLPATTSLTDDVLKQRTLSRLHNKGFEVKVESYYGWDVGTLSGCYGQYRLEVKSKK